MDLPPEMRTGPHHPAATPTEVERVQVKALGRAWEEKTTSSLRIQSAALSAFEVMRHVDVPPPLQQRLFVVRGDLQASSSPPLNASTHKQLASDLTAESLQVCAIAARCWSTSPRAEFGPLRSLLDTLLLLNGLQTDSSTAVAGLLDRIQQEAIPSDTTLHLLCNEGLHALQQVAQSRPDMKVEALQQHLEALLLHPPSDATARQAIVLLSVGLCSACHVLSSDSPLSMSEYLAGATYWQAAENWLPHLAMSASTGANRFAESIQPLDVENLEGVPLHTHQTCLPLLEAAFRLS